jgi:hypothetical protein
MILWIKVFSDQESSLSVDDGMKLREFFLATEEKK